MNDVTTPADEPTAERDSSCPPWCEIDFTDRSGDMHQGTRQLAYGFRLTVTGWDGGHEILLERPSEGEGILNLDQLELLALDLTDAVTWLRRSLGADVAGAVSVTAAAVAAAVPETFTAAMPETDCPSWCTRDHVADWLPRSSQVGFEPLHELVLVDEDLPGEFSVEVTVVQSGPTCEPSLMWGNAVTTPDRMRDIARALLAAADRFEEVTA